MDDEDHPYDDDHLHTAMLAAMLATHEEPTSYEEAISGDNAEGWKQSMLEEYTSLEQRGVFELCTLPPGRKPLTSKWAYKVKRGPTGEVVRLKSRFVARGCSQIKGVDYHELFSPVCTFVSIRTFMALVATLRLHTHQYDIETAYLFSDLAETVYCLPPKGYERRNKEGRLLVWKLRKSLYGLRQSGRNWFLTLAAWLRDYGLTQSQADPGLFFALDKNTGQLNAVLLVYVDDLMLGAESLEWIARFQDAMSRRFTVKDIGEVCWALGVHVHRDASTGIIRLSQQQYIKDVLSKFGMQDCSPAATPAAMGQDLTPQGRPLDDGTEFKSLVGSLMYAAIATRPDIAAAVGMLSRYMDKPEEQHWTAAKRVLRYLKGTYDRGISFGSKDDLKLKGYVDSDWAGDRASRRSRTGYIFYLCGGPVSWKSQLQHSIALSTVEAEYMAMAAAAQEALALRSLLNELGSPQSDPTPLLEDNQGTISLAENDMTHSRSKHIDIRYHFIRDHIKRGTIETVYCPTADNVADIFTKPLPAPRFIALAHSILDQRPATAMLAPSIPRIATGLRYHIPRDVIEHLFEPCGGLCVGLEAVLRNRIMVKRYSYCDPDKQVRLIAQHRIRQLQENAPELLPASACAHWDSALPHDVQDISPDMLQQLPEVTLLIAGPPCQPWSAAGQQLGWEDPRAAVFKVVINLLNYMINHQSTPPRFVIENVKGATRSAVLGAALGPPTVLQAHLLGSAARRAPPYGPIWQTCTRHGQGRQPEAPASSVQPSRRCSPSGEPPTGQHLTRISNFSRSSSAAMPATPSVRTVEVPAPACSCIMAAWRSPALSSGNAPWDSLPIAQRHQGPVNHCVDGLSAPPST